MAILPKTNGPYDLGRLYHSSPVKEDVWRNFGFDGTNNLSDVIWIGQEETKHIMPFKAFLENIKLNITSEFSYSSDKDKWRRVSKGYTGDFSIDISLKIPAHSVNESRNNLAKIENLQKLILNGTQTTQKGVGPLFYVFFRNIINSGLDFESLPSVSSFSDVRKMGFPCFIETVKFEPDLDMGFFEYDSYQRGEEWSNFPFPKVITLNLTLKYENKNHPFEKKPLFSFMTNGEYFPQDNKIFPFLATSPKHGKGALFDNVKNVFNEKRPFLGGQTSFIYFEKLEHKLIFPAFLEGFNRNYEIDHHIIEDKANWVGKGLDIGKISVPKSLTYDISFNVPNRDILEARFNSWQIQKLIRLFYRPFDGGFRGRKFLKDKIYVPGFIEKGGSPRIIPNPLSMNFSAYSLNLNMDSLNLEILSEQGFLEDNDGKLYPKVFKIEMTLSSDLHGEELISPHDKSESGKWGNKNELFPFNRKTIRF